MHPDAVTPWFALATSTPPPNWTDPAAWEAMPPGERLAAWTEYRSTQPRSTPNE